MKRSIFSVVILTLLAVVSAQAPVAQAKAPDHKVAICHIPPGNPANAHVIVIDWHAVPAHFANHGDFFADDGSCPAEDGGGEDETPS